MIHRKVSRTGNEPFDFIINSLIAIAIVKNSPRLRTMDDRPFLQAALEYLDGMLDKADSSDALYIARAIAAIADYLDSVPPYPERLPLELHLDTA